MKKRVICFLLIVLLAGFSLMGCGTKKTADATGEKAVGKDTVVAGVTAEPRTLDPILAPDRNTFQVLTSLFDTLTIMPDNDSPIEPGLAESWKEAEDGKSIVFKIRKGVLFHNGDELTPEDVVFSFNAAIAKAPNKLMTGAMDRMEKTGADEVTLYLKYSFKPMISILSQPTLAIVNQKAYEADPEGFARNPVGTGPFKFKEWKSGDRVILERFDDYYRGAAKYKTLIVRTMIDPNTAVIALENGELDVIPSLPNSDRENLKNNDKLSYDEKPSSNFNMIILNNRDGIFSNKYMRLAVSYATNRDEIIKGAIEGVGTPLYVPMAPGVFGYPEDFKPLEYSVEKAKEMLQKANYDGEEIHIKCTESKERVKVAEILQAQLSKAGFNVQVETMESGRFFQECYGQMKYEIGIFNMTSDYPDGDSPTYTRFHSSLIGNTNNYFGANNKELDEALDTGRFSLDDKEREAAYHKVCDIVRDEAIIVPLYIGMNNVVSNKHLKGPKANSVLRMYYYDCYWE